MGAHPPQGELAVFSARNVELDLFRGEKVQKSPALRDSRERGVGRIVRTRKAKTADEGNWDPPPKTGMEAVTCNARPQFSARFLGLLRRRRPIPVRGVGPSCDPPRKAATPLLAPTFSPAIGARSCASNDAFFALVCDPPLCVTAPPVTCNVPHLKTVVASTHSSSGPAMKTYFTSKD
jgi:hypothetical protein